MYEEDLATSGTPTPATITLRGQTTAGAASTSLTLAKPAGVVAGDVLIAQVSTRDPAATLSAPSGWTEIRRDARTSIAQTLYYKVATASEPSSYTWSSSTSTSLGGGILAYSGVDTTTPIDAHGGQTSSSTSVTAPSITTTVAQTTLVFFGNLAWGYASFTPPSGMTEQYEQRTSDVHVSSEAADQVQASAGATGTRVATASASSSNIGQLIALRPQLVNSGGQTGVTRSLYQFNGQIIAQRSSDATGLLYLHSDHLGSVSLVTNANGAVVSRQDFDPWGQPPQRRHSADDSQRHRAAP